MTKKVMRLLVPAKQLRPPFGAKSLCEHIPLYWLTTGAVQAKQNSSAANTSNEFH
jgi:hypothetical protein